MAAIPDQELKQRLEQQASQLIDLEKQHSVLEERMKTLQSDLQGTLERFRADMADWKTDMADWKTDMADWKTDMAQRENRQLLATIVIVGVATAILGLLIAGIPSA